MYHYTGILFNGEDEYRLRRIGSPLDKPIEHLHVTVQYKPKNPHRHLFGEKVSVQVIGYNKSQKNEGLQVRVRALGNPELQELLDQIPLPHITLSIAHNAKAVDTRYLPFEPIEPIELMGTFGALVEEVITK